MKKSEIKHSLEKINWALFGVIDMIDRPKEILTEHLKMLGDETEAALNLVIALCDYMIDDGEVDLTEDLQLIHDKASEITGGKYGKIPEDAKTDERYPLFSRVLFNISDMPGEIRSYWHFVEELKKQPNGRPDGSIMDAENQPEPIAEITNTIGTTTGDKAFPDILTTDEQKQAWKKAIKDGFMEKTENGYKWKLKPANTLAFFVGKLFGYKRVNNNGVFQNVGGQVPYDKLESKFNVKRLDRALAQLYDAKKVQMWRKYIDKLFE